MRGEAKLLLKFLDGSDNRYIIPVYQRNYDCLIRNRSKKKNSFR